MARRALTALCALEPAGNGYLSVVSRVSFDAAMGSKVAVVAFDENNAQESFERALKLVGGISDLSTAKRSVVNQSRRF